MSSQVCVRYWRRCSTQVSFSSARDEEKQEQGPDPRADGKENRSQIQGAFGARRFQGAHARSGGRQQRSTDQARLALLVGAGRRLAPPKLPHARSGPCGLPFRGRGRASGKFLSGRGAWRVASPLPGSRPLVRPCKPAARPSRCPRSSARHHGQCVLRGPPTGPVFPSHLSSVATRVLPGRLALILLPQAVVAEPCPPSSGPITSCGYLAPVPIPRHEPCFSALALCGLIGPLH